MVDHETAHSPDRAAPAGRTGDEGALLAEIAQGDQRALTELYDRYASVLLGVATRILRSRADAEDLLHDVFIEAWRNAGSYDPSRGSVRAWLVMRVRSRAIDRLRSLGTARKHAMARAVDPSLTNPIALPPGEQRFDAGVARKAVAELPPAQRAVIELSYFEALSCQQVAERCGIPIGTVKSRLFAAVARLRESLRSEEEPTDVRR